MYLGDFSQDLHEDFASFHNLTDRLDVACRIDSRFDRH